MIFRQLFDYETWTYTYVLADEYTKEAIIIDPVYEQSERDAKLIKELELKLLYMIDTHVHADHITGSSMLKRHFPEAKIILSEQGGTNHPDVLVRDGDTVIFGSYTASILSTPGHTNGCISIVADGKVFTGDSLLIRGCGRTDFQQGSPELMYHSVTQKLFVLPDETEVYPGHNYAGFEKSTIAEEKAFNPRFANKTKEEFIEIMNNLHLPHPKKLAESVPANLVCGNISTLSHSQSS